MNDETKPLPLDLPLPLTVAETAPPALNPYEQQAANIVAVLDLIASRMPGLEAPHPSTSRRVRGARMVPLEFVLALIDAVETTPRIQAMGLFDAADARHALQANDGSRTVARHLETLLTNINYTVEARWSKVAQAALQTYLVLRLKAKDPKNADLAGHVEHLRRLLGRKEAAKGRKKRAPKASGESTGDSE